MEIGWRLIERDPASRILEIGDPYHGVKMMLLSCGEFIAYHINICDKEEAKEKSCQS